MVRIVLLFFFISMLVHQDALRAQSGTTENLWKTLTKITYKKEYDEFLGFKIDRPVFSEEIKALEIGRAHV